MFFKVEDQNVNIQFKIFRFLFTIFFPKKLLALIWLHHPYKVAFTFAKDVQNKDKEQHAL